MKFKEFFEYYLDALRKYIVFEGRASRKDFWLFVLINTIITAAIRLVEAIVGMDDGFISSLYTIAMMCPNITLNTRRLHDVNKSGWWQLASVVPLLNLYYFYILLIKRGDSEANKFGAPTGAAVEAKPVYGEYTVSAEEPKATEKADSYVAPVPNEFSSYEMCPAPAAKKCSACGTEIVGDAKFCSECGAPVNK